MLTDLAWNITFSRKYSLKYLQICTGCLSHVPTIAPYFPTSKDSSNHIATTFFIHLYLPQNGGYPSREQTHTPVPHIGKPQSPNYRSLIISSNAAEWTQEVLLCHSNMLVTLSLGQIVVKLMSKLLSIQEVVIIQNTLHRCEYCLFWAKSHKRAKSNFLFLDHNIPLFMENNCTASPKICNFW